MTVGSDHSARIRVRKYGESGPWVVVLHGGPGGAGNAAPIARGLADSFRVLEPWQRGGGGESLTVARHVADLDKLIRARCGGEKPALVGESWGAMLALAYAAEHPGTAGPLVLIGCGTFDPAARALMRQIIHERLGDDGRRRMERLEEDFADPDERLREQYRLVHPVFDYDPVDEDEDEGDAGTFDVRAHTETWTDMLRMQEAGTYPAAFAAVTSAVLMLHGTYDPHPGRMVRDGLRPFLPQIEYREWERCGHSPWHERHVREEFFEVLHHWLKRRLAEAAAPAGDVPEHLRQHVGLDVFGPAYRSMNERDSHAPGSVDRVLLDRMVGLCGETIPFLYSGFTLAETGYLEGSRPVLEEAAARATDGAASDEERVAALARFTAGLGRKVAGLSLDDTRMGGTEEDVLARGSDWCTDVARVACALYQVAGLPARIVYLVDLRKAYSGHVINEVFRQGVWGAVDTSTGVVYRSPAGRPLSVKELMAQPDLVEAHRRPGAGYTNPGQFSAAAVSNYFVQDAACYDYAVSGVNDYYRSILEHSERGWPGGLRWLHGEDATR